MIVIPFKSNKIGRGSIIVVMILEKENLDRMKQADPFDIQFSPYSKFIDINSPIKDLDFIIAYEEDTNKLMEFKQNNDLEGLISWIERGREIKPGEPHLPVPLRKN